MALFGGTADERREPRSLVEFRAGKMSLSQGVATADKRKGLVYMKTSSDSLLHFCWKDRQTGEVVDDLIIFPGEAEFVTIPQCTTGRVFLLKFKDHSSRKFFYWMQEPSNSKDKELAKKVNELLTNPPEGGGGEGGLPDLPPGYMAIPSSQLQSMLSGGRVDQQQLMELLGGAAGGIPHALAGGGLGRAGGVTAERASSQVSHTPTSSALPTATPRAPNRPTRSQQQQLDDLQSILSSLNVPGGTSAAESQQSSPEDAVNLNEVFSSNIIRPLANDEEVVSEVTHPCLLRCFLSAAGFGGANNCISYQSCFTRCLSLSV
jgi:26S proteasome regulatory subunit N13